MIFLRLENSHRMALIYGSGFEMVRKSSSLISILEVMFPMFFFGIEDGSIVLFES